MKNKYIEEYYISFLFIILPALQFYTKNYINSQYYVPEFLLFCYIGITFTILLSIYKIFQKYLSLSASLLLIFSFLYFLQFQNLSLFNLSNSLDLSVSYFYIIIITIFFIFFLKLYSPFTKFLILFTTILLCLTLYDFLKTLNSNIIVNQDINKTFNQSNNIKNPAKIDIIYIISDASMPFENVFNSKKNSLYRSQFEDMGFKYFENTKSNFNITSLTLTTILRLDDNFIKKRSLINDELTELNISTRNLYPVVLKNNYQNNSLKLKLNELGINFEWIGNIYFNCNLYRIKSCQSTIESKKFYYLNLFYKFISDSLIDFNSTKKLFRQISKSYAFENRDVSLNDLMKILNEKKYNRNFYLVHHFLPHEPYIYSDNINCNFLKNNELYLTDYELYKIQYECNIKNILSKVQYILENNPSSIIVIQGDHGYFENRDEILNLVKYPSICKKYFLNKKRDNSNTLNAILNCVKEENL